MRVSGQESWQIRVDNGCPQQFGIALFVRAAAGLDPHITPAVPPLDEAVIAKASSGHDFEAAARQWAAWRDALVDGDQGLFEMMSPDFAGLAGSPQLRELVAELFEPAVAWTGGRADQLREELRRRGHPPLGIEGAVVRAAEREAGCRARPFILRVTELPVTGAWRGRRDAHHLLVSEQLRADDGAYRPVLRPLVDALL